MSEKINSTGKKSSEEREDNYNKENSSRQTAYGIQIPVERGSEGGESLFKMNYSLWKQISNNYKMFLTIRRGEILCKPDFGTSIIETYNRTDLEIDDIENIIMKDLQESTAKYFPYIKLMSFESKLIPGDENTPKYYQVEINYNIISTENKEKNMSKNTVVLHVRRSE